jgi:hypothetical protein
MHPQVLVAFSCCGDWQTLDPSSVQNFGTLLETHQEQAGGGAVAFARLLVPLVKIGLMTCSWILRQGRANGEALARYSRKYVQICEDYRG